MPTVQHMARARALPLIALVYMEATFASAWRYWRGTGASWKRRDYGAPA